MVTVLEMLEFMRNTLPPQPKKFARIGDERKYLSKSDPVATVVQCFACPLRMTFEGVVPLTYATVWDLAVQHGWFVDSHGRVYCPDCARKASPEGQP